MSKNKRIQLEKNKKKVAFKEIKRIYEKLGQPGIDNAIQNGEIDSVDFLNYHLQGTSSNYIATNPTPITEITLPNGTVLKGKFTIEEALRLSNTGVFTNTPNYTPMPFYYHSTPIETPYIPYCTQVSMTHS